MINTYAVYPFFGAAQNEIEILFSLLKMSKLRKRVIPFCLKKDPFCYAGGCPYFPNKALDKVYIASN